MSDFGAKMGKNGQNPYIPYTSLHPNVRPQTRTSTGLSTIPYILTLILFLSIFKKIAILEKNFFCFVRSKM